MKQIFHSYEKWEDFKFGLYNLNDVIDKDLKVIDSINLLSNVMKFETVCNELLEKWPVATEVNLTNNNQNRRAWLGAAACMFNHNSPEYLTRIAWNLLNKEKQYLANKTADKIIQLYERKNNNVHQNMGETMLLQWNTR